MWLSQKNIENRTSQEANHAKLRCRTAKAVRTHINKTLRIKLQNNRPPGEITEVLQKVKQAYYLVVKHEEFAQNIENDEEFETEEKWLEESQDAYLLLECTTNDYIMNKNKQHTLGGSVERPDTSSGNSRSEAQMNTEQSETFREASATEQSSNNVQENVQQSTTTSCGFKMERPKMPQFSGDVRDYVIFRADFKYAVDSKCGKRDAMSLLRTSLSGRPLELIKGIDSDYNAAW
ncbi:Hypothetical predicted protein [Paramuricea clavata]|uniref:Uncharacterized protein n=1 Tax=Paramuricea clavata TaxID=317549 RepID=A0A6S7FIF4_PARCT|nr:Hypothetical predicted protein [Paramuricea clavata]